ncbi:syntaxin-17-like protein [Dinothrombium tinctorium]|uniref:Syntaxin-17-like protein n=1 Tax=Dinothrombium tinctorium TaxID=1965070 RepID=A0A3S3PEX2_9ACAR|nr:syntaxin-17-like protein [Dinothrombium tinctorium]RWS11024.1 syntaxin-17-like protein [Dinothrombium tinctorium]RWS11026.1 syntaxin-17-like protein [Dinothrombium tinctorium]
MIEGETKQRQTPESSVKRYPISRIRVTLRNIVQYTIPLYIDLLHKQSLQLQKFKSEKNWELFNKEQVNATTTVKQLKFSVAELERLKHQVVPEDLKQLEKEIAPIRTQIIAAIEIFFEENKEVKVDELSFTEDNVCPQVEDNCLDFNESSDTQQQIEILETRNLHTERTILKAWTILTNELSSLHSMVNTLASFVATQKTYVDNIEANVDHAAECVGEGVQSLSKAAALKRAMLPMTGAFCGGIIGGPVGMYAGLKVGVAAAALGSLVGYFGGKALKNSNSKYDDNEFEMLTYDSSNSMEKKSN